MNEENAFLQERFQCRDRAEDLTDNHEENRPETILYSGIRCSLQIVENQSDQDSENDRHDDLRDEHRRTTKGISQCSLSDIEGLGGQRTGYSSRVLLVMMIIVSSVPWLGERSLQSSFIGIVETFQALRIVRCVDQEIQDEIGGIVVYFALIALSIEMRHHLFRGTLKDCSALGEK